MIPRTTLFPSSSHVFWKQQLHHSKEKLGNKGQRASSIEKNRSFQIKNNYVQNCQKQEKNKEKKEKQPLVTLEYIESCKAFSILYLFLLCTLGKIKT